MPRVFISYRLDDSAYAAHIIFEKLSGHFGPDSLVYDVDTIPLGVDFVTYLNDQVGQCDALLALIGDNWLTARNASGKRRLDDPDDFVRIEIQAALRRGIPVVPVLVGKAAMPRKTDLPRGLKELTRRNAAEVRSGRDVGAHLDRLATGLDRVLALAAAAPAPVRPEPVSQAAGKPPKEAPVPPARPKEIVTPTIIEAPAEPGQVISNSIGMKLTMIPAGAFVMGSEEYESEKPPHRVQITTPFWLGVHQVTQADYQIVVGENPSRCTGNDQHPVERVSWFDAVAFCNRLSERENLPIYYRIDGDKVEINGGLGYRLPTEAEWEYACRAGTTTRWYCGDDEAGLKAYAWYGDNSAETTHPLGEKKPNAWGLYDMHGNVWEWCWDWYDASFYRQSPDRDPSGPASGSARVLRGGSWSYDADGLRSPFRIGNLPASAGFNGGVRAARALRKP